jgi:hypothetical protein
MSLYGIRLQSDAPLALGQRVGLLIKMAVAGLQADGSWNKSFCVELFRCTPPVSLESKVLARQRGGCGDESERSAKLGRHIPN